MDGGRDHSLAIYRAAVFVLFAAVVVTANGIGQWREAREQARWQLAAPHPDAVPIDDGRRQ